MEVIIERACGLDVHQASVVACVLVSDTARTKRKAKKHRRTFGTVAKELRELVVWLKELGVTHVAMEATGVYWKPVYEALEEHFDVTVANARHIQNVPGRKTDVTDAEWIARLLRLGLLEKSFIPAKEFRLLRDLTRQRRSLVNDRSAVRNRILKLLESRTVKLSTFISDVFGVSGMDMLRALAKGELSIEAMAKLARGRMRQKMPDLQLALEGRLEAVHRRQLQLLLAQHDALDGFISEIEGLIDDHVAGHSSAVERLCTIPGVSRQTALDILGELGADLSSFPSAKKLASWVGVCPGNRLTAGKSKGGRRRKGNAHLQGVLYESALAASRTKGTYLRNKYFRLKARRGHMRAAFAIAHKIVNAVYAVLTRQESYNELGESHLDEKNKSAVLRRLKNRLHALGYEIVPIVKDASHAAEHLLDTIVKNPGPTKSAT